MGRKNNHEKWIINLGPWCAGASAIGTIVGAILIIWSTPVGSEIGKAVTAVSFVSLLISAFSTLHALLRRQADSIDQIKKEFQLLGNQRKFQKVDSFRDDIWERLGDFDCVRNTYVGMEGTHHNEESPDSLYVEFFKRNPNGSWTDVIGLGDVSSKRYEKMGALPKVRVNLLKHTPPFVNFILLGNHGRDEEVYFGWLGAPYSRLRMTSLPEAAVFHSADSDVVRLFSDHFKLLKKTYGWADREGYHLEVADSGLVPAEPPKGDDRFVYKDGWWYSELRPTSSEAPTKRAFLKFDFAYKSDKDKNDIHVFMTNSDGSFFTYAAHGQVLAHDNNSLYFAWRQSEPEKSGDGEVSWVRKSGECMYKFIPDSPSDRIEGYVLEEGVREHDLVFGKRLIGKPADRIEAYFSNLQYNTNDRGMRLIEESDMNFFSGEMRRYISSY